MTGVQTCALPICLLPFLPIILGRQILSRILRFFRKVACWKTKPKALYGLSAPFSAIWLICGWRRTHRVAGKPSTRYGRGEGRSRSRTRSSTSRSTDRMPRRTGEPSRRRLWSLIDGLFRAGDATPTPLPAGNTHRVTRACASTPERCRRLPPSASLRRVAHGPAGWVTDASDLTQNQQITALGNEVLALQASCAMDRMLATTPWIRDVP